MRMSAKVSMPEKNTCCNRGGFSGEATNGMMPESNSGCGFVPEFHPTGQG